MFITYTKNSKYVFTQIVAHVLITKNMSKSFHSKTLFDSDEEEERGFKTNERYAKHYNEFRKKEILSHGELKKVINCTE